MALVLKTSDTERYRGFESLSLRHFHNLWAMQKYPSGRRGSPAKGVGCGKRRVGSNPTFCARRKSLSFKDFFFFRFCKRKNSFISDKFPFMFERVVFKNERQKLTRTDKERPPGKGGLLSFTDVRQIRPDLLQDTGMGKWQYWGKLKNVDYSSVPDSAGEGTDQTRISEGQAAFITGNKVNFRTGPGTGYTKLLMLNKGDVVEVLETSNGWAKCAYQGKTGYVSSVYISTAEVDNSTPISGAEGGVHITSSGGRVNIRRGNGTEYSVITSVVPGTILPYVAKAVNGWLAVKTGSRSGGSTQILHLQTS